MAVVAPKVVKFRKRFVDRLKKEPGQQSEGKGINN
jgi:hypothetical protein